MENRTKISVAVAVAVVAGLIFYMYKQNMQLREKVNEYKLECSNMNDANAELTNVLQELSSNAKAQKTSDEEEEA